VRKETMASEWRQLPFSEAVALNPSVQLERGKHYPFVDMGAVSPAHAASMQQKSVNFLVVALDSKTAIP
jgi:hypothetical protein